MPRDTYLLYGRCPFGVLFSLAEKERFSRNAKRSVALLSPTVRAALAHRSVALTGRLPLEKSPFFRHRRRSIFLPLLPVPVAQVQIFHSKTKNIATRLGGYIFCQRAIIRYFRSFLFRFELTRSNMPKVCIPSMQKKYFYNGFEASFFYKALLKCCHNIIKIFYVSYENCNYRITVTRAIRYAVGMIYIVSI